LLKRIYILIISFAFVASGFSQNTFWLIDSTNNNINWDIASEILQLDDGSFYLPHEEKMQNGSEIWLSKYTDDGLLINRALVTDSIDSYSNFFVQKSILQISPSTILISCLKVLDTVNFTLDSTLISLYKYDIYGNFLQLIELDLSSSTNFDLRDSYSDSDSTFLLLGAINQIGSNTIDISLIKLDTNLNVIWNKRYGDSSFDLGMSISPTSDGGYIIGGLRQVPGSQKANSIYLKIDPFGNEIWRKYYGTPHNDGGRCMITTLPNDHFVMLSRDWRDGEQYSDLLLTRFNEVGDSLWSVRYEKAGETEYPFSPPVLIDNGDMLLPALYYDSTTTHSPNGGTVGWVLKVDSLGTILWEQDLNYFADSNGLQFVSYNNFYDIKLTNNNEIVLSGTMNRIDLTGQDTYILLAKLDSNGCVLSQCANYTSVPEYEEEKTEAFHILVYPNPSSGMFTFKSSELDRQLILNVYDITGRVIDTDQFILLNWIYRHLKTVFMSIQFLMEMEIYKPEESFLENKSLLYLLKNIRNSTIYFNYSFSRL
jgi:hypothetical protein